MALPSRTETTARARWWRSLDRGTLTGVFLLVAIGYILMLAASPAVANRIGASSRHFFVIRQVIFLTLAMGVILATSRLSLKGVRNLAFLVGVLALGTTALTLVHGMEIKGARRWISLPFMSLQPSEFLKPCFAVITAWLISQRNKLSFRDHRPVPVRLVACLVFAVILFLLQSQPDIGMLSVIMAVFAVQLFIDGLPVFIFSLLLVAMAAAFGVAYLSFHHVRSRVERFLHPDIGDHYQIDTSLRALGSGGWLGRGPGEGRVKDLLPDAHADFIFAVAGEEYGFLLCALIIGIFIYLVLRSLTRLTREKDPFIIISVTGLITGFGLQAFINMGSTLHLIPTKGMTLPLISYGGSSALSIGLTLGMILALTRHRAGTAEFFTTSGTPSSAETFIANRKGSTS